MIMDPFGHVLGSGLSVMSENGGVDTYNGTGLMNGSMDKQSKPGQVVLRSGAQLTRCGMAPTDRRREISEP